MENVFGYKKQYNIKDTLFPVPPALIVSGIERPNITSIAWTGIVSSTPPSIEISIHKKRHCLDLIKKHKEFSVNIPSADKYIETDYCGIVSGTTRNKFLDTGFTAMKSTLIQVPIIKECPLNLECKVTHEIEIGDFIMFVGEIVETHIDKDKFIDKTNNVDIGKINPLIYISSIREYWTIGKKLGKGFECGKILKEELSKENITN